MNFFKFQNLKKLLIPCLGVFALFACNEDDEEWDITELEVTTPNLDIPYTGGSHTFSFKTNNKWEISCTDEWVSFDKTSGTGDATITATFADNSTDYNRTSYIKLTSGEDPTSNNVVGVKNRTVSALQHSLYQDKVDEVNVQLENVYCSEDYISGDRYTSSHYQYSVRAEINITSKVLNINELIVEVGIGIYCTEYYRGEEKTIRYSRKLLAGNNTVEWEEGYYNGWSVTKIAIEPYMTYKLPDGNTLTKYYERVPVTITNI